MQISETFSSSTAFCNSCEKLQTLLLLCSSVLLHKRIIIHNLERSQEVGLNMVKFVVKVKIFSVLKVFTPYLFKYWEILLNNV